jgi:type I restriction enzyme, S subunit
MKRAILPEGWFRTTLDNVANWGSGGTPSRKEPAYYNGKIPWVKTGDLGPKALYTPSEYITELGIQNSSAKIFPKGSVAMAMYGATIGKTSILEVDAATNQACCVGNPISGLIYSDFLYYFLVNEKDNFIAKAKGGAQPNISQTLIKKHEITLPPLAEQRVIVNKLDTMLTQVELIKARLERINCILKTFRQSVLAAALSGKLTEEWRDGQCFSTKHGVVGDFVSIDVGHAFKSKEFTDAGVKLLRGQNIEPGSLKWDETKYFSKDKLEDYSHLFVRANDIILAMDRPIISTGLKLARAKEKDLPCVLVQRVARFSNFDYLTPDFLYLLLSDTGFTNYIQFNQTGSDIPHISGKQILSYKIEIPTIAEQDEIVRRVEDLFVLSNFIEHKTTSALERVNNLTPSILAKAFNGELTANWRTANQELISGESSAESVVKKYMTERESIKKQPNLKHTSVKKKAGHHMGKQIIKVIEALKQARKPLSGQQLLAAAGYPTDSGTDQLEQFFLDIRDALTIEKSIVKLERDENGQDWFALAKTDTNK